VYNEVDQFVLVHLLCVEVCYQETDVVALSNSNATNDIVYTAYNITSTVLQKKTGLENEA